MIKYALLPLFALMFLAQVALSQPAVTLGDAEPSPGDVTSFSTENFAVSGTDVVLLACVYSEDGGGSSATTGVTWNGVEAFTKLVEVGAGVFFNASWWYLINPTQTTENVDVTLTGTSTSTVHVAIVTGASQDPPTLSNSNTCDGCTLLEADLTTTVDNTLLLTCTGTGAAGETWTYGTGQTELALLQNATGNLLASASSTELKATAGLETLSSTSANERFNRIVVMGIEPAAEAARVARWTFDQTLVDAEGNANLTYGGAGTPSYVTGLLSDAIDLDGDNFTTAGVHSIGGTSLFADTGNPFSVSLYFKTSAATGVILSSAGGGTVAEWDFTLGLVNGDVSARLRGTATLSDAPGYNDGEWHHLVVTWDETTAELYIDGELETALGVGESTQDIGQDIIVGSMDGGTVNFFTGTIDDVHIYNYELSAGEISALADALPEPPPGPSVSLGDGHPSPGDVASYSTDNFVVSGDNVVLLACVYSEGGGSNSDPVSVTWNGSEDFMKLGEVGAGVFYNASWWYLVNPTRTTENVDVTLTGNTTSTVHVAIVEGASQSAPTLFNSNTCDSCTLLETDLTTTVDNTLLLTCTGTGTDTETWTYGPGQTELALVQNATGNLMASGSSTEPKGAAGLETLSSTSANARNNRMAVMGIEPFTEAPPSLARRRITPW
jgi:hypothetical protein